MVPRGGRATSGRNAARGRGRGRGAAAGAPADEPPVDAEPDDDIDYALHPIGIIVYSHDPPKDIRFTISRDLFKSYPAATFDALPARMTGVIDQWVRKAEGKLKISWPFDESNTVKYLSSLLAKDLDMRLETYESGRAAPKAKGMQAKQRYAVALASGPYAYHTPTGVEEGSPTADGNCPFQKGGAWARWRSVPERGRYRLRPSTGAAQPAIKKARFARSWALVGLPVHLPTAFYVCGVPCLPPFQRSWHRRFALGVAPASSCAPASS